MNRARQNDSERGKHGEEREIARHRGDVADRECEQPKANRDEMLLEVEEAERLPMAVALERRP